MDGTGALKEPVGKEAVTDGGKDVAGGKIYYTRLVGDISYDKVEKAMREIDEANAQEAYSQIHMTLTTSGGELYPAFGLYDHIQASKKPIDIVATGVCMSSGVMILQAARRRVSRPHTTFMVHPSSTAIEESYQTFLVIAEQYKRNHEQLVKLLIARVGLERAEWDALWAPRRYFTAQEARAIGKHGFIDAVE